MSRRKHTNFADLTEIVNLNMEVKVQIPFDELVAIVRQLSSTQKAKLQKELTQEVEPVAKKSRLTELLLNGPVFTEDQIKTIEETRKSINQWRTKPL
ncbi:hypothetical protein [Mucilaginibacter arboris]|uniref:Uncharacterized protein n=1 Tax=Mucilaginibacter arboris TaxID=2682090 RepID=A0A7K1STU4_9SPHI|nr:hypothetical protein [Mucilaginibacter arboris]MVN20490.1 hypothetical protein [Mucilaginibacter arboris]